MKSGIRTHIIRLLLFFGLWNATSVFAQEIVIKPEESITPWFGFTEWLLNNAGIPFGSYDLNTFAILDASTGLVTSEPPMILINGHPYQSKSLINDEFRLPNISFQSIDSVVVDLNSQFRNGWQSTTGFIEIYLKKGDKQAVIFSNGLINEVNDPGPMVSTELATPNVEAIGYDFNLTFWSKKFLNTMVLLDVNSLSRANQIGYDHSINNTLFSRTRFTGFETDHPFTKNLAGLQYNITSDLLIQNSFRVDGFEFQISNELQQQPRFFSWNPTIGLDPPYNSLKRQHSIQIINGDGIFRSLSSSYTSNNIDSVASFDPSIQISSFDIRNTMYLTPGYGINLVLDQQYEQLTNLRTSEETQFSLFTGSLIYESQKEHEIRITAGNGLQSASVEIPLHRNYRLTTRTKRKDLLMYNNNLSRWKAGIGVNNPNRTRSVRFAPDLVNSFTEIGLSRSVSTQKFSADMTLLATYHWSLSTMRIQYEPIERGFSSQIDVNRLSGISTSTFRGNVNWQVRHNLRLRSLLTLNYELNGDTAFREFNKRVPAVLSSHFLNYQYNRNTHLELSFKYISSRFIEEFEGIQEKSALILPPIVRPVYLLSFTSNIFFFDQRLMLSMSLSNLFNQTISYNTNGQYYDLSLAVKATLQI